MIGLSTNALVNIIKTEEIVIELILRMIFMKNHVVYITTKIMMKIIYIQSEEVKWINSL